MKTLIDYIKNGEYYKKEFETWEASEQKIDDRKTIYCLKKPDNEYEKVCLYTDGYFMCVYGDYGSFTFDSMTWKGDVFNLQYDNVGYQMEKLSHDSKNSLRVYDDQNCEEDIIEWLKERLKIRYNLEDEFIIKTVDFVKNTDYLSLFDFEEFCEENDCHDIKDILEFVGECFDHTDEYEWISFLRQSNELEQFDEVCESDLWNAGVEIHKKYFVNMLALQICGNKLKNNEM